MDIYVARQPIFNKKKKLYGYELLFRDRLSNAFPDVDGDMATSKVLSHSFLSFGMDRMTSGRNAFINFTNQLLVKRIPLLFPKTRLVVEVLEDVEPADPVVEACRELRCMGYRLALDDFVYKKEMEPLMALAGIVKVDFMLTQGDQLTDLVRKLTRFHIKLLAEKVETYEAFRQALDLGFEYFQGYFFSKPEILRGKGPSSAKLTLLQIMAEANRQDCSFQEIEKVIQRDVSLSYKLMRYINSAYFRRAQEISSMRQAIVLLGEKEIRRFVSLMALASLAEDKPGELMRASIVRAKLCELLGKVNSTQVDEAELFILGLFSLIDAILDQPMEAVMKELPLADEIKGAIVKGEGRLAPYLHVVSAYESGDWEGLKDAAAKAGIQEDALPQHYLEAVVWAENIASL